MTEPTTKVGRPLKAVTEKRHADILHLRRSTRLTQVEIARELGITPAAVGYHLKQAREQRAREQAEAQEADAAAGGQEVDTETPASADVS